MLCFVVVMQSFIMNSHEVFIHIHQGCFAGTGAIVRLPQCQWSKPDGYGKISQCITTTKHSKAKTMCIFLGIYCMSVCVQPELCVNTEYNYHKLVNGCNKTTNLLFPSLVLYTENRHCYSYVYLQMRMQIKEGLILWFSDQLGTRIDITVRSKVQSW